MTRNALSMALLLTGLLLAGAHPAVAQETALYSFNGATGAVPKATLLADSKGNLYGTTLNGGANDEGTVFELSPAAGGNGWTQTVLYSFYSTSTDGANPESQLIFDSAGNLYGTTNLGGEHGAGTVFELSPQASGSWTEKILYSLGASGTDAAFHSGGLVFDTSGDLYGATDQGGQYGFGAVFELVPASGSWTENLLYSFNPITNPFQTQAPDGSTPEGSLIIDGHGNLYGVTFVGGANKSGAVFELSPGGGGSWTETLLYSFGALDANYNLLSGIYPGAGLVMDAQGNLYGTTTLGGTSCTSTDVSCGQVFELSPAGSGQPWVLNSLYNFGENNLDGSTPLDSLSFDAHGNLYGTTAGGGQTGVGTAFELTPAGTSQPWLETILHTFGEGSQDGAFPVGGLILDSQGNVYGTTAAGGANNDGTVFEIAAYTGPATPVFSPSPANYSSGPVTISDATAGAAIYFTTDGTTPTAASTPYTTPLTVSANETLQAIAVASGTSSPVSSAVYEPNGMTAGTPFFIPAAGAYPSGQNVILADATQGAAIYYTTDGSTPTTSSTPFTAPIAVSSSETIKALAIFTNSSGMVTTSTVNSAAYTIQSSSSQPSSTVVATPVFSPAAGTYSASQNVGITDTTPGATIYYTTNGSTPTTSSTKYTGAITVSTTETIEAIGVAAGYNNSAVASAAYAINLTPNFSVALSPTALTVDSGRSATTTVTVTPENGFDQPVSFACSGLPAGATCSFSPTTLTPNGASSTTTLTVSLNTATASIDRHTHLPLAPFTPLAAVVGFIGLRRRRTHPLTGLAIALMVLPLMSACHHSGASPTPTAVTVTATAGSLSHSVTLSLTVNGT